LKFFEEKGFDSYFSGCVTLTLPKQKTTADAGTYACLVDLNPELTEAAREHLKETDLEVRIKTHRCDYRFSTATFEERMHTVEELLTEYQNARVVITRRLHVALPCLAMGVPVVTIVDMGDAGNVTRWRPYEDWVHFISEEDFKNGNFIYDFQNPPKNIDCHLEVRERLIAEITAFVDEMKACQLPLAMVKKTTYSERQAYEWKHQVMKETLDKWLPNSRKLLKQRDTARQELKEVKKELNRTRRQLEKAQEVLSWDGILIRAIRKFKRLLKGVK